MVTPSGRMIMSHMTAASNSWMQLGDIGEGLINPKFLTAISPIPYILCGDQSQWRIIQTFLR